MKNQKSNGMSVNRQFSKTEISKILSKASEIQTQKDLYGSQDGLSTEELIELAKEVGIDKDSLIEAIERHDEPTQETSFNWLTGTSKLLESHTFTGEVSDENWEEIVREIRKATAGIGHVAKVGSSFEWEQRKRDFGYKHISLTPENGKTTVQMVNYWSRFKVMATAFPILGTLVLFILFSKSLGYEPNVGALLPFAGLFGFGISRIILKSYFTKQKEQVKQLFISIGKKLGKTSAIEPEISLENGFEEVNVEATSKTRIRE